MHVRFCAKRARNIAARYLAKRGVSLDGALWLLLGKHARSEVTA